jgi:hypothetical protein
LLQLNNVVTLINTCFQSQVWFILKLNRLRQLKTKSKRGGQMVENSPNKISLFDINLGAFQALHGNPPELQIQDNKVLFLFSVDDEFARISTLYYSNAQTKIMDFVAALRSLRSKMLQAKENGNGNGNRNGNYK